MAGKITYALPVEKASGKIFGKKTSFIAVTRLGFLPLHLTPRL